MDKRFIVPGLSTESCVLVDNPPSSAHLSTPAPLLVDKHIHTCLPVREAHLKVGENKTIEYITPKDNASQQCPIPNYFYKVVLKVNKSGDTVTSASTIGFWFEHKDYSDKAYENNAVSVDQIEEWTGFDFFVNLPDTVEAEAESNASWSTFQSF